MKIISGILKGRTIEGFQLDGTRPTMERVKESLFAMIQENLVDAKVLDLFSGSGNLGIEAISQGAKEVVLVDHNKKAIETIQKNIKKLNIENQVNLIHHDYKSALRKLQNKKFDLIFLDPPYQTDYIEKSILMITEYDLLEEEGLIICESSSSDKIVYPKNYKEKKKKKYGDKVVVILEKI